MSSAGAHAQPTFQPVNENVFPHSYMVLEGMIQDLASYEGVLMYSMHMLPQRRERRRMIYDSILNQGCSLHIVLESIVISSADQIAKVEELIELNQIATQLHRNLPIN